VQTSSTRLSATRWKKFHLQKWDSGSFRSRIWTTPEGRGVGEVPVSVEIMVGDNNVVEVVGVGSGH